MHSNSGTTRIAYASRYASLVGNTGKPPVAAALVLAELRKPA